MSYRQITLELDRIAELEARVLAEVRRVQSELRRQERRRLR